MTPIETRRDRHKQERLRRIKQAAWHLFTTQGYSTTTIRQIAEQADVAAATVILHAGDKAELLLLVFHDAIAQRIKIPHVTEDRALDVTVLGLFQPFIRFYGEYPELARDFSRELLYGKNRWQEQEIQQAEHFIEHLAEVVKCSRDRGEMRKDTEPILLAQALFGLYQAGLQAWFCGALSFEAIEPTLTRQFKWQVEVHRP